jgi:hypothetical protein
MELHNQTSDLTIGNVKLFLRDPKGQVVTIGLSKQTRVRFCVPRGFV